MPIHSIYFNFLISFSKQFNACAHNQPTKKATKRKKKGYIWSPQTHHDISFTNTTTDVVPKASNKHFMDRICHIRLTHVTKLQNSTSQVLIKPTFSYYVQEITVIGEIDLWGVTAIIIVTCHCKTSPISSTTNKAPIFSLISSHQGSFEKPQFFPQFVSFRMPH